MLRRTVQISLFVGLAFALTAQNSCLCPNGQISNNHCYTYYPEGKSWQEGQANCFLQGGTLATIRDNSEQSLVSSLAGGAVAWIGYTDAAQEGTWIWAGVPSQYTYWCSGEPNNSGDEDCAVINWQPSGCWNDLACSRVLGYVCETPL